jgi:AraC-like DNA-binding protein
LLRISTSASPERDRSRYWRDAIASAYFPLDLQFRRPDAFAGELQEWTLGEVSLSRLTSEPLLYCRLGHHFRDEREEYYLVTVPVVSQVYFAQSGKEVRCGPGALLLERSHEPYVFSHEEAADLWVMKISAAALAGRVRKPDRFCSMGFDATAGGGALLRDMLDLLSRRLENMSAELRATVGRQLIDLVALALKEDARTLDSSSTAVRAGHLARIESVVRERLGDANLDPDHISAACRISTRYLHELLRDTDQTIGGYIRELRLESCRAALAQPGRREALAEVAYRAGFSDQAQFSRLFRTRYGKTPRDYRDEARLAALR